MRLSNISVVAAFGLLLVAGCQKESTQPPPGARKIEVVTSNGTYDWYLGDTLINGTNAGTNRVVSVQRITGVAKELTPTNKPARPSSEK